MKKLAIFTLATLLATPVLANNMQFAESTKSKQQSMQKDRGTTGSVGIQNEPNAEDQVGKGDQRFVPRTQRGSGQETGGPARELIPSR